MSILWSPYFFGSGKPAIPGQHNKSRLFQTKTLLRICVSRDIHQKRSLIRARAWCTYTGHLLIALIVLLLYNLEMVEGPNPRFPPLVKPRLEQNSQIFVRNQGRNQVGFHPDLANSQVFLASVFSSSSHQRCELCRLGMW